MVLAAADGSSSALIMAFAVMGVGFAVVIAPLALSQSRGSKALTAFALLLTLAAGGVASLSFMGGVIGVAIGQVLGGTLWLGALMCGIAGCLQNAAEHRANDTIFRFLFNDGDKLVPPDELRAKYDAARRQKGGQH